MKTNLSIFTLLTAVAAVGFAGCQRSTAYKKDQDYASGDPQSYYSAPPGAQNITEKVESMGQPKKRVVVLDFWNDTPIKSADLGRFAADELRRQLSATQRVIVPKDLQLTTKTADFVDGDQVRVGQLVREGRNLGVSTLILGRITKAVFRTKGDEIGLFRQKQSLAAIDVELKMFDVQNGREIMASGKSGEASAQALAAFERDSLDSKEARLELLSLALRKAVSMLSPEVVKSIEKMTWEGAIAKIMNGKFYLNAGKTSGLVAGDILKVMTAGDDIYDPNSGAYLGRTQGELKGTLEVVDFLDADGAVAQIHTGGNFQEGDLVQLY